MATTTKLNDAKITLGVSIIKNIEYENVRNIEPVSKVTATGTFFYDNSTVVDLYSTIFAIDSKTNFFLSPIWICEWLELLTNKPELITFHQGNQLCGFVLVGYQSGFSGDKVFINQSGDRLLDQVWIEYNDVISQSQQKECREALLNYLGQKPNIYQIHISNTSENHWQNMYWKEWSTEKVKAYETCLSDKAISENFSKNTKRQISRSMSFIEEEFGPITMLWLDKHNVKKNWEEIGNLHIKQWDSHPYGSGFSNPHFVDFHVNLIDKGLGEYIQIAKFETREHTLGFLYFFCFSKRVYFYLSSINYLTDNNKFKPGLIMHEKAMQYFKDLNFKYYDFLAGEARYKSSLCSKEYELYNKILFANKLKFKPLKWLVDFKRSLQKRVNA